jgi:hypothetical protein
LKCDKFDRLIHLFLDGRLEKDEESELQEHLSTCEECAQKLALLKSMEAAAKKIEAEEPSKEYWDTFSSRVRERIVQREEKSLASGLKKALQGLFSFSPLKIRVAAGLISVVLVFIVGKLYVDYRGQEIIPRKAIIRSEEQPHLDVTKVEEKGEISEAEYRDGAAPPPEEPKRERKAVDIEEPKKKATPPGEPISGEEMAAEELGAPTASEVTTDRGISAPTLSPDVQTLAEPEGSSKQLSEETEATGAGMKNEAKGKAAIEMPTRAEGAGKEEGVSTKAEQERMAREVRDILTRQYGFVGPDRFLLDQNMVSRMDEHDTLKSADELKRAIQIWKDYIKENPDDSLTSQGYLQVATAYHLLAKLSQDTTIISEGTDLIEGYLDRVAEPELERKLTDILNKINALKEE